MNRKTNRAEWARSLYNNSILNIGFSKKQIWRTVYYSLLIYSGIFALIRLFCFNPKDRLIGFLLYIAIFFITNISLNFLYRIYYDIKNERKCIDSIRTQYPVIKQILNIEEIYFEEEKSVTYDIEYLFTFYIAIIIGFIFLIIVLIKTFNISTLDIIFIGLIYIFLKLILTIAKIINNIFRNRNFIIHDIIFVLLLSCISVILLYNYQ